MVLGEDEKRAIEKAPTENIQAYEYYLRGRQLQHQWRRTGMQYARRMFDRAIEIDPNFARAYAGVADCCSFLYMYWDASNANLEEADASSRKALDLDPESPEAHTSRAVALTLRRSYQEAREEFEAALRLNPMLYEAHYFYGRACFTEGIICRESRRLFARSHLRCTVSQTEATARICHWAVEHSPMLQPGQFPWKVGLLAAVARRLRAERKKQPLRQLANKARQQARICD